MLTKFVTNDKVLSLLQTSWASDIDPILANPILQGIPIKNVALNVGPTVINHLLGRNQQGYIITDQQGIADIYRSAAFNNKTLTLTSNANVTVSLWVY